MELRHLRSFLAVAEELHFGRAATRLHISQPPLSQQIRRLEDEIGARLFRRTNRRVQLTPAGRAFLAEARQAIACAERAVGAAQRAERGELGELVIGYVTSATYGPLPDVIRVFRKRLPEVQLKLRNLRSVQQSQALLDRRIDVGLVRPHAADSRIAYEALWREPVVVALPSDHPLAHRTAVDIADLATDIFLIAPAEEVPPPSTTKCSRSAGKQASHPVSMTELPMYRQRSRWSPRDSGSTPSRPPFRDSDDGASSIARCDHAVYGSSWDWRGGATTTPRSCSSSGESRVRRLGVPSADVQRDEEAVRA